jgi:hypothetical protein
VLGAGTTANHTESLRAKFKRLVARGVVTEPEPACSSSASPPPAALRNGHSAIPEGVYRAL